MRQVTILLCFGLGLILNTRAYAQTQDANLLAQVKSGMAVADNPTAAKIGARILKAGGDAIDLLWQPPSLWGLSIHSLLVLEAVDLLLFIAMMALKVFDFQEKSHRNEQLRTCLSMNRGKSCQV